MKAQVGSYKTEVEQLCLRATAPLSEEFTAGSGAIVQFAVERLSARISITLGSGQLSKDNLSLCICSEPAWKMQAVSGRITQFNVGTKVRA